MKKVFCVTVNDRISHKAYATHDLAIEFVINRSDKPKSVFKNGFIFKSETNTYKIFEMSVKNK